VSVSRAPADRAAGARTCPWWCTTGPQHVPASIDRDGTISFNHDARLMADEVNEVTVAQAVLVYADGTAAHPEPAQLYVFLQDSDDLPPAKALEIGTALIRAAHLLADINGEPQQPELDHRAAS